MSFFRLALLLVLQAVVVTAWAVDSLTETQIKAAYLSKFAAYVEWPASAFAEVDTPLTIGVMGAEDIAKELHFITKERTVNDRVVQVKSLELGDSLTGVQILYVGQQDEVRLKRLLESLQSMPILTITASPVRYAGSVINFIPVANHIRFEVSATQAEQKNLKISARLLSVAQKIETGSQ
ncbi:MAG: YfiR family protein [Pseudomonadota bacterium]